MNRFAGMIVMCGALLALSACSGAKEKLGLTHPPPDEFAVIKRAPLAMPPDYTLRPPEPGAVRPQEAAENDQARAVVFGGPEVAQQKPAATSTESFLLQQTGGSAADPSIRQEVDQETATMEPVKKPVAERLLGWTGVVGSGSGDDAATVVDPAAEAARLKKNDEEGKPVTEGETPTKEQ